MDFEVRMHQVDLVNALRAYIERRLRFKLGRHAGQVRTLKFRLTEQDSTAGSGPKLCFLAAKLVPSGEVIVAAVSCGLFEVNLAPETTIFPKTGWPRPCATDRASPARIA